MQEISLEEIKNYKPKRKSHSDYTYGGWYMIICNINGKKYIGKSIDYKHRLKQHINLKNPKTLIDKVILEKGLKYFSFYLIDVYDSYNVNFFNRKIEGKVENNLIKNHKSFIPYGYNVRYYE